MITVTTLFVRLFLMSCYPDPQFFAQIDCFTNDIVFTVYGSHFSFRPQRCSCFMNFHHKKSHIFDLELSIKVCNVKVWQQTFSYCKSFPPSLESNCEVLLSLLFSSLFFCLFSYLTFDYVRLVLCLTVQGCVSPRELKRLKQPLRAFKEPEFWRVLFLLHTLFFSCKQV